MGAGGGESGVGACLLLSLPLTFLFIPASHHIAQNTRERGGEHSILLGSDRKDEQVERQARRKHARNLAPSQEVD